jgi:hypothetical protein
LSTLGLDPPRSSASAAGFGVEAADDVGTAACIDGVRPDARVNRTAATTITTATAAIGTSEFARRDEDAPSSAPSTAATAVSGSLQRWHLRQPA